MKPVAFDYEKAASAGQAAGLLGGEGNRKVISGGQSLGPMLNLRLVRPDLLVDVRRAEELRQVREADDSITYGAAICHAEFEDGLVPDAAAGMMRYVAGGIAYRAVRTRGTIGGSLAHADPAADWVLTLITLDAVLNLAGPQGSRSLPATGFFFGAFTTALQDGEIIESVTVPRLGAGAAWGYYKICRKTGEFAEASGALVVDPSRGYCRLAMGAVDGPPIVLDRVADALAERGSEGIGTLGAAVRAALPDASPVSLRQHEVALRRAIQQVYPS